MSKKEMVIQAVQELKVVVEVLRKHQEFEVAEKVEELIGLISAPETLMKGSKRPLFDIDKALCRTTSTLKLIELIQRIISSF